MEKTKAESRDCPKCGGTHIGDRPGNCPLSADYVADKPWPKNVHHHEPFCTLAASEIKEVYGDFIGAGTGGDRSTYGLAAIIERHWQAARPSVPEQGQAPSNIWTKQDYDHSAAISTVVERIVKRVAENAVRLAIVRHDLENDTELTAEEIVKDVLGVVLGEDVSCDPDDDESVEILWAEKELRETLKEYPARAESALAASRSEATSPNVLYIRCMTHKDFIWKSIEEGE